MALTWEWSKLSGTITENVCGKEYAFNFYEGNAMMIVLHEYVNEESKEVYELRWFFCDEEHAKRMLGLAKGYESGFEPDEVTKLTLYRDNCRQWEKIVKLFAKAFPNVEIIIRASKEEPA